MHSTVQTGIYNPNLYDHHHNHYFNYNQVGGRPGSPSRQNNYHHPHHPPKTHHLKRNANVQSNKAQPTSMHGACSSTNLSLLAIDHDQGQNLSVSRINVSASNMSNFSSHKHLDLINRPLSIENHKKLSVVSAGPMLLQHSASAHNIHSFNANNSNEKTSSRNESLSNFSYKSERRLANSSLCEQIQWFFDCSKPCGMLTLALGVCLLVLNVVSFLFIYHDRLCASFDTCENALLKTGAVSSLVIGVVFLFFGSVIVVYSKKDFNTKVIIASARDIGQIAKKKEYNRSEVFKIEKLNSTIVLDKVNRQNGETSHEPLLNNSKSNDQHNNQISNDSV